MAVSWTPLPRGFGANLPIIGSHFAKLGQIEQIYAQTCSPTAEVWVYGFFQAIPHLFMTLRKPELIDINISHRRGRPRKGKKLKFYADIFWRDNLINIPVPRWVVFRAYGLYQRAGYYLLVADALEDFTINWMSLAYKGNGCQLETLVYCRYDGHHILCGGFSGPQIWDIPSTATVTSNIELAPGQFGLILPGNYRAFFTVSFEPYEIPTESEMPFNVFLWCMTTDSVALILELSTDEQGHRVATGGINIEMGSGRADFEVRGEFANSGVCYATLAISVDRWAASEIGPDP